MQLRVFADEREALHLEVSSPSLLYSRRLFVPMLLSSDPLLKAIDDRTLIDVWYADNRYKVPYLLLHSEEARLKIWKQAGKIEESDSRNVLNHILDILAWD